MLILFFNLFVSRDYIKKIKNIMRTIFIFFILIICSVTIFAFDLKTRVPKEENFFEKLTSRNVNNDKFSTEKVQRDETGIEKMIQLMNILGQVDSFFTRKTKNLIRRLNAVYEQDDPDPK